MAMVAPVVVGLTWWIGLPELSAAGALILSIQGLSLWWMGRRPELADLASHGACATGTLALTYGVYGVGLPGVITVYFSSLIILSAAHILGRQAACLWAVPSLVLIAATVFAPPTVIRDVDPVVTFAVRAVTVLTILAFAVRYGADRDLHTADLSRRAMTDPLTNLANRAGLEEALERELARIARHDGHGGLIFLDLDGLKVINDEISHAAGDDLLRTVSHRLQGATRRIDTVARLGGDEFVVLLTQIANEQATEVVARKLLDAIAQPCEIEGQHVHPGASAGIVTFDNPTQTAESWIAAADDAMYAAKRAGGRRIYRCSASGVEEVL